MFIRENLYCTTQHFPSHIAYPNIESLLASLEEQTTIHQLPIVLKEFMDELVTLATVGDEPSLNEYWSSITDFMLKNESLIRTLDNIRLLTLVATDKGNQIALIDDAYPVIEACSSGQVMAVIEPYRLPLTECRLSLLSSTVSKVRAIGNLNILNTMLPLNQHIFMINNESKLSNLIEQDAHGIATLFERLNASFGKYLMVPSAFEKLFLRRLSLTPDDFINAYLDLLVEVELVTSWGPEANKVKVQIEDARNEVNTLRDTLSVASTFSVSMTGQQFLDQIQLAHPLDWREKLLTAGVDGIGYSNDTSSLSAQKGRPLINKYEFFDKAALDGDTTVALSRQVLEKQEHLSVAYDSPTFKAICRRVQHINQIFDALLLAKFQPKSLDSYDIAKPIAAFIRLLKLSKLSSLQNAEVTHAE